jgi:GTP-binding protein HflX
MEKNRRTMRAAREKNGIPEIAIVGYTNAGKSTLLNRLTDAGILAEDKLFATLDPTTRKFTLPCGEQILLTDTVGFINKLPHHLVSAFRSTLEAACFADILMIITDASDEKFREQLDVTEQLLAELGAADKPTLYVFNKCDRGIAEPPRIGRAADENTVYISALTGQGVDALVSKLESIVLEGKRRVTYLIPNSDAGALNILYKNATVESVDYGAEGMTVIALADAKARGMMKKYAIDDVPDQKEDWE